MRKPCILLLLIAPLISGCPDLSQVQKLAKTAVSGKSSLASVAADLKGSCDRQNMYYTLPSGEASQPPVNCADGDDLKKLAANLAKEQAILIAYFDALGSLAGTSTSGFDGVAPKLDTSFKNAGFDATQQEMAKASGTLADAITKLATGAYKEKKIVELLRDTNEAVKIATTGLANQVCPDPEPTAGGNIASYMGILQNEDSAISSFYDPIERKFGTDNPSGAVLRLQHLAALADQEKRREAARAYRKYMLALQDAHSRLANAGAFGTNDTANIAKELAQPLSDMADAINTLQKDAR